MNYAYYKSACKKCNRKILVEVILIGTNHNSVVISTCADCLELDETSNFKKENLDAFNDIQKWSKSE